MKKIITFSLCVCLSIAIGKAQTAAEFQQMLSEINADSIKASVQTLENFTSRLATHGNREVAQYLVGRMNQYGLTNVEIDSFYVNQAYSWLIGGPIQQYMYNVKGALQGNVQPDSIVIIGAHYDCITANSDYTIIYDTTAGADDNASGVALMLEIARVFHNHQFVPRYTIHFMAFDGEEFGLYGSQHDAQQRHNNQEKVAVMLNNDMVANDPNDQGLMTIYWYENSMQERSDAALMCDNFTTITPVIYDVAGNGLNQNSDSYSYFLQGFHAVFAIENEFSPYYHTPLDNTNQYNYNFTAEIAKMNLAMLIHYAYHDVFDLPDAITSYDAAVQSPYLTPNPVTTNTVISFYLNAGTKVQLSLFNIAGQKILDMPAENLAAGYHQKSIAVQPLPTGIYFCQLATPQGSKTVKLIKK